MKCQRRRSSPSNGNATFARCSGVRPARNFDAAVAIVADDRSAATIDPAAHAATAPAASQTRAEVTVCISRPFPPDLLRADSSRIIASVTAARMFVTAVLAAGAAAQSAELDDVLARARAYVAALQNQLSGVVVEETYEQFSRNFSPTRPTTASPPLVRRPLPSDLLPVKPQGPQRWSQVRDRLAADGQSGRARSRRLVELCLKPTGSTRSQAERIMTESARFKVGGIERNLNVPLMALMMLMKESAARFRYKRSTKSAPQLIRREADSARSEEHTSELQS